MADSEWRAKRPMAVGKAICHQPPALRDDSVR